jgi:hypothetical protein
MVVLGQFLLLCVGLWLISLIPDVIREVIRLQQLEK